MKKVNVKYLVTSFERFHKDFQKILDVFADDEISHLEIHLVMDAVNAKEVGKIVNSIAKNQTINEITNDTIYTLAATVSPIREVVKNFLKVRQILSRILLTGVVENDITLKETIPALRAKGLPCCLLIRGDDIGRIVGICRKNAVLGTPIFIEGEVLYDDKFLSLFQEWLYDKNSCRINLFADILSWVLLDDWGTKCQYKSCLTKHFLIDEDGIIYACKNRKNRICGLWDVHSISEILSHEKFVTLLERSVARREQCKAACELYGLCKGGCPADLDMADLECGERRLFAAMEGISGLLYRIVRNSDYRDLNPAVRSIILSSIASNKIFEKRILG